MKKLTEAEWDAAFANLEASDWPEERKDYYRRTWTFIREGRSYSRKDFQIAASGAGTRSSTTGY